MALMSITHRQLRCRFRPLSVATLSLYIASNYLKFHKNALNVTRKSHSRLSNDMTITWQTEKPGPYLMAGVYGFKSPEMLTRKLFGNVNKNSSGDEIANVNFLRRHRTCRGQRLRPL